MVKVHNGDVIRTSDISGMNIGSIRNNLNETIGSLSHVFTLLISN